MGYRSFTNSRSIETTPDRLWAMLLDPRSMSVFADHPVSVAPSGPLQGVVGEAWTETHGPECDDDRVRCVLVAVERSRRLRLRTKQRGVEQTVEYTLTPVDGARTELRERIVFAPTFAGKPGQHIISWLLLLTGLLAKLGNDEGKSLEALARAVPRADAKEAMVAQAAQFVLDADPEARAGLDYSRSSLRTVDDMLGELHRRRDPLSEDRLLLASAYVFEALRRAFGGEYRGGDDENPWILVIGEPDFQIDVLVMGKIAGRVENGEEDDLVFFCDGIPALIEARRSATLI
ncbi:hypothetical protein ASE14_16075 [Agromyces sp. Root81]|uniref:SRPBCC family protein n=1 Tax=Agromyces sp. Root81 TaxID=1736601 RepID=UPI0006FF0B0D|nr:SRPBCC family protein [Agromyces sp. Root81]KRC59272.1 hypothetical protein ASE14_16075 [Agromyces sp. Root81]